MEVNELYGLDLVTAQHEQMLVAAERWLWIKENCEIILPNGQLAECEGDIDRAMLDNRHGAGDRQGRINT